MFALAGAPDPNRPQSIPDRGPDAKRANSKARGRDGAMAENTYEKAERQDNPGGIPQCYAMGHHSSGKEDDG
jgi:hypothetical protein